MKHIVQLSDIHLCSDYGGHLDTQAQWKAVLKHAKENCPNGSDGYDAVVITGDLVDDDNLLDPDNNCSSWSHELSESEKFSLYMQILTDAKRLLGSGGQLVVTPGNHDNRELLGKAAVVAGVAGASEDMFLKPGKCLQLFSIGHTSIVAMDTGNGEPYEAISDLAYAANTSRGWNRDRTLLFTHKPFKIQNLYHRFMKNNMLDETLARHMMQYAGYYFCGHLHHYASLVCGNRLESVTTVTLCPSVQGQIDPYTEKCNAVQLPGYLQISCCDITSTVNVKLQMVDNWKDLIAK